jgi:hypothetical protein
MPFNWFWTATARSVSDASTSKPMRDRGRAGDTTFSLQIAGIIHFWVIWGFSIAFVGHITGMTVTGYPRDKRTGASCGD